MNVHFSFNGKKSLKEGSRSERGGHCRKVSPHGSQKALLHKSDLQRGTASSEGVPAGSPSRGGNVAVYVFDINQPSLPTLFILFLCLFLFLWSFQLYFIPQILPTTPRFLTLFFRSHLCLYMSLHESLLQP